MEIITNRNVETQEQLLNELKDAGFRSTQATISRDIKELRIVKELTSFGTYRYATSSDEMTGTYDIILLLTKQLLNKEVVTFLKNHF